MKKKIIYMVPAVSILLALSCQTQDTRPESPFSRDTIPDNPATAFVQAMGIGINIGNTLDAIGTNDWHSGEVGWGNPPISREFVRALKKYGYTAIRLPVTWAEYMGPAPDFKIARCVFPNCTLGCPDRMNRVEEVVNWILDEGMYCILNLHHDGGHSDKSWILKAETDTEGTVRQFSAVWKQIAERFRDAPDKLVLEAMNEVGFDNLWNRWNSAAQETKGKAYDILNTLNQTFVDTVRNTGGSNASRFLLVSGYWTDIDCTIDPFFQMPQDTLEDRLVLSVHYYTPPTFCILEEDASWGRNQADWGSRADYDELYAQMGKLRSRFIDKGIPIILGEYGVSMKNKVEAGRVKWMTAVTQACLDNGMCPALWDTGGEIKRQPPFAMSASLKGVLSAIKK